MSSGLCGLSECAVSICPCVITIKASLLSSPCPGGIREKLHQAFLSFFFFFSSLSSGAKASRESSLKFTIRPICWQFPSSQLLHPSYPAVNSLQSRGMTHGNLTAALGCSIQGNIQSCSCLSAKDDKYLSSLDTPPGSFIFMILFYPVF